MTKPVRPLPDQDRGDRPGQRADAEHAVFGDRYPAFPVSQPVRAAIQDASVLSDKHDSIEVTICSIAVDQLLQPGRACARPGRRRKADQQCKKPCHCNCSPQHGLPPFHGVLQDGAGHRLTSLIDAAQ